MLQTILQTIGADAAQNAASLGVSGQGVGGKTGQDGAPANFAAFLAEGGAQGGVASPVGAQGGLLNGLKSAPGVATAVAAGALDVAAVPVAVGSGVVELARAALTTDSNTAEGRALAQAAPSTGVLDELLQGGAVTAVAVPNEAALGQEGGVLSSAGLDVAIGTGVSAEASEPVVPITEGPDGRANLDVDGVTPQVTEASVEGVLPTATAGADVGPAKPVGAPSVLSPTVTLTPVEGLAAPAIASAATTQTPAAQPATAPVPHITDRPTPTAVPNTAPAQPAAPAGIAPVPVQAGSAAAQIIPNSASNTVAKIDVAAQGMTPSGADASKQLALSQFSGPSPVAPLVSTGKPQPNGQAAPPPLATAPTSPNADSASNVRLGQPELTAPAVSGRLGAIHAQHAVQPANPKAVKSAAGSDVKSAPNAAAATALNIVPDAEAETAIFAPTVAGKPDTGLAEAAPVTQVGLSAKTPALEALLTPTTAAIAPERAGVPELIRFDQALPQELREVNATAKETTFNASTDKPAPTSRLGEAVMAQIKSAQVEDGRTHIALKPSGLGQIEIVIQTTEDAASKVIVKVDNPAVLTTLRDDRQYLAQAIGVSDGTTLEFQSGSSSQDSSEEHAGQGGFTGFEDMGTSEPVIAAPQSRIIEDTSLDITT